MKAIRVSLPEPAWVEIMDAVDFYKDADSSQSDDLLDAKALLLTALRLATNGRIA